MARSWEILRHVTRDEHSREVLGRSKSTSAYQPHLCTWIIADNFVMRRDHKCPGRFSSCMTNLLTFSILGERPYLPQEALNALSEASGPVLTEFRAPLHGTHWRASREAFSCFKMLHTLTLVIRPWDDDAMFSDVLGLHDALRVVPQDFRCLHAGVNSIWGGQTRFYANLQERVLQDFTSLD
ncbi:hypothetical protein BD413DRAFT_223561 [Trametes elegans]|nr:hypothetical protein BD413DRAFT_223561 [Trametes elegans]